MRVLEKTLIVLSVMGIVLNELHIAGAAILMVVGISSLAVLYFIFNWLLFRDRNTKMQRLSLSAPAGVVFAIACIGILFKLMVWPGSNSPLGFAAITLITVICATFYLQRKNKENDELKYFYRNVMQRAVPFFFLVFACILISDTDLIRFRYRDDPEYARLYLRVKEFPENPQYWKELEDYQLKKYDKGIPAQ